MSIYTHVYIIAYSVYPTGRSDKDRHSKRKCKNTTDSSFSAITSYASLKVKVLWNEIFVNFTRNFLCENIIINTIISYHVHSPLFVNT